MIPHQASVTDPQARFARTEAPQVPRSQLRRTSGHKTTFDEGLLIPFFYDEALPGDTFNLKTTTMCRLATQHVPIMDNLWIDTFYFAVPYRLVWDNWQKMNGEQINPGDSTDFQTPIMTPPVGGFLPNTLYDYFGLPMEIEGFDVVCFHMRAYSLIWNEWFRSQDLQDSVVVKKDDGPDDPADYQLLRRGKRPDYFTSCLPFPQKGPSVLLPLGTSAPVNPLTAATAPTFHVAGNAQVRTLNEDAPGQSFNVHVSTGGTEVAGILQWEASGLEADLSNATAATINQIREAFQIQRLYERDARGGSRYTETLRAHFGVVSDDARLQRSEFLGGGSHRMSINQVEQSNWAIVQARPLGSLAAYGIEVGQDGFVKSFTEHSLIIGMCMVRADLNYQQGLHRMWSRRTRWDYYWPSLAHIGEQAVLNQEIYTQGSAGGSDDTDVFGYQGRYDEYRYAQSRITGTLRSSHSVSLDIWHLAQDFSSLPALGPAFIEENPPVERIIAVTTEPHFILDAHFDLTCARPIPTYGVPGLVDHF